MSSAPTASSIAFHEILARRIGGGRQLRIFNANRDIVKVVREIADATEVAAVPP